MSLFFQRSITLFRVLLVFCTFLLGLAQASAASEVTGIHITQFGIFAGEVKQAAGRDAAGNPQAELVNMQLLQRTEGIPGTLHTEFGIEYVVLGQPLGSKVTVGLKIVHPAVTDPGTKQTTQGVTWTKEVVVGGKTYSGYGFDNAWEMAPGEWTMEISHNGKKLAAKTFVVYQP